MKTMGFKFSLFCVTILVISMLTVGCSHMTRTQKGATIGSAAGGNIGTVIGEKAGNPAVGAIIGGAIGGSAGALIGRNMDKQAEEIRKTIPGAEVIKESEGLIVKFDSGILFDLDKAELKDEARTNIRNLAITLKDNPETDIMIIGHTDDSDSQNYRLSELRTEAVKNYAIANGVASSRLTTISKSEPELRTDNVTGKAQNQHVEIVIVASEKMKSVAKTNTQ